MRRRMFWVVLLATVLGGCVSPYTKMEQHDLRWYAEDRYSYADAMPARDKEEGFRKVQAYWEAIEAIRHLKENDAALVLDGTSMTRDDAREQVRRKIKRTEETAGITSSDYCGRAIVWTGLIPYRIVKTPVDAVFMLFESPATNIEW